MLRFKNSLFRQKLHHKILRLEKMGRKDEILRMLKEMKDFDSSMQSGDGPCDLVEEILGPRTCDDDDIEVLGHAAVSAIRSREGKSEEHVEELLEPNAPSGLATKNDIGDRKEKTFKSTGVVADTEREADTSMSAESDDPRDLAGVAGYKKANDFTASQRKVTRPMKEEMSEKSVSNSKSTAKTGGTSSPSGVQQEVIDLCDDDGVDQDPNKTKPSKTAKEDAKTVPEVADNVSLTQSMIDVSTPANENGAAKPTAAADEDGNEAPNMAAATSATSPTANATKNTKAEVKEGAPTPPMAKREDFITQNMTGFATPAVSPSAKSTDASELSPTAETPEAPITGDISSSVQAVLQEWISEDTATTGSSATNGTIDGSAHDHHPISEDSNSSVNSSSEGNQSEQQIECIDLSQEVVHLNINQQLEVIDLTHLGNWPVAGCQASNANEVIVLD